MVVVMTQDATEADIEQVCEKVQQYVDLGCTGFIPWCSDYPDTESMDLFASEVMPNFR